MNGGSFMTATSQPLTAPMPVPKMRPQRIEISVGKAIAKSKLSHDDRRNHGYGTDAEINPGRQDHKALRRRDDPDNLNLLQDERQGKGREEFTAKQNPENDDRRDKNDQGNKRWGRVQGMMKAFCRPLLSRIE